MSMAAGNSLGFVQFTLPKKLDKYVLFGDYKANEILRVGRFDDFQTNFRSFSISISSAAASDLTFNIMGTTERTSGVKETLTIATGQTKSAVSQFEYKDVQIVPTAAGVEIFVNRELGYVVSQFAGQKSTHFISTGDDQEWSLEGAVWDDAWPSITNWNEDLLVRNYFPIASSVKEQTGSMPYPYYLEMPLGRVRCVIESVDEGDEADIVWQFNARQLVTR